MTDDVHSRITNVSRPMLTLFPALRKDGAIFTALGYRGGKLIQSASL